MKTILSAFKNFGRKDRARSRSEPCVHDLRADSPSVTKLSSSDLKYRGKLSVKERELLSQKMAYCKQMGEFNFEEEVKDEETSSCHMFSDDEKEWNYGENAKNSEKTKEKPRKKYKTSNLFTLTAQGRDFSCCTFDRDEGSNLLYLSSFGPMEKWNMRLQTGTRKLWVGDRLVSINGCVVRSLGALKELLLTHDEAFIEFMFMKLDHSKPSKPKKLNSKKDKWSAVEGPRNQSTKTLTPANSSISLDLFSPCSTEPGSVLYSGCGEGEERSATRSEDKVGLASARAASRVALGMSLGKGRGLLGEGIIAPPKVVEGFSTTLKESSSVPFSVGFSGWKEDSVAPPDSEVDEVPLQRYELEGQRKSESPGACSDEKTHELPETEGENVGDHRRRHRSLDGSCSEANGTRRRPAVLPRGGGLGSAAARIRLQPLEDGAVKFVPKKAGRPGPPNNSNKGDCIVEQPGAAPHDYRPLAKSKNTGVSVRPGVSRRPKTTQIRLVKRQPRLRQKEASPELDERDIFGDVRSPLGMLRASMFI